MNEKEYLMIINDIGFENVYENSKKNRKKIACPFGYQQRFKFEIRGILIIYTIYMLYIEMRDHTALGY